MDYSGRNDPEKSIRINPFRRVTFDHIGRHFVGAAFRVDGWGIHINSAAQGVVHRIGEVSGLGSVAAVEFRIDGLLSWRKTTKKAVWLSVV